MSELLHSEKDRSYNLYSYVHRLIDGENGRMLVDAYKPYINTVTPAETMQVLDALLVNNYPFETVKKNVGKIINAFYHSLQATEREEPAEGSFLHYLMLENREVEKIMAEIRAVLRPLMNGSSSLDSVLLAKLFYVVLPLVFREEKSVFPVALRAIPERAWQEMLVQSTEIGVDAQPMLKECTVAPSRYVRM